MKKRFWTIILLAVLAAGCGRREPEMDLGGVAVNVSKATLTAVLPEEEAGADRTAASGRTAVVVCPGGAFIDLEMEKEGFAVARALADRGIAAFVLKYRTRPMGATREEAEAQIRAIVAQIFSPDHDPDWPLISRRGGGPEARAVETAWKDGLWALKKVRRQARRYGIDPERIGMMGFSAGAVLTLNVAMDHGADSRPAFAVPIYGGWVDPVEVPADACPMYLVSPQEDIFPPEMTGSIYEAWTRAGVPAELHYYKGVGHGFGLGVPGTESENWLDGLLAFLKANGLLD